MHKVSLEDMSDSERLEFFEDCARRRDAEVLRLRDEISCLTYEAHSYWERAQAIRTSLKDA